jgi:serine O-acetyltransferase
LKPEAVDAFVAKTLRSALRAVQGQIKQELALDEDASPQDATAKTQSFAAALAQVRALADSDARAGFDGDPSAVSMDEVIFSFPGFAAVLRHRLAHELHKLGAPLIARIAAEDAHGRTGVDIHPGAEIGEGFFIDHGTGVVIGETTVIGRNVRLYQGVTLGAKRFETEETGALRKGYPRHPIVEDDVVIYAGATILGRIVIGRGASIGGGVWLTQSVAPGGNVTQVPARREAFTNGSGI